MTFRRVTGGSDELDDVAFDEDFVRAGRREDSADARLAVFSRIAREHAAAESWRTSSPLALAAPQARRRHHLGTVVLVLSLALGLLVAASALVDERTGRFALSRTGVDPAELSRLVPLPPDPGGSGGYRFLSTLDDGSGRPVRYDPCRPLVYVVNRQHEPPGADALIEAAFAEVGAATGLVLQRGPDTDERYVEDRQLVQPERYGPDFAPVLITWSDEREASLLSDDVVGFGGSQAYGWRAPESFRYVTGAIVMDAEDAAHTLLAPAGQAQLRSVLMHELGHVLGLDHVRDADEVMHPRATDQLRLGPGDLRGLRALGSGPCIADWSDLAAAS